MLIGSVVVYLAITIAIGLWAACVCGLAASIVGMVAGALVPGGHAVVHAHHHGSQH